jgi:putative alpha-1,2-mannosidase
MKGFESEDTAQRFSKHDGKVMNDTVPTRVRTLRFISRRIVTSDKGVVFRDIGIRWLICYCLLAALPTVCAITPQREFAAVDSYRLVDPRIGTANDGQTYPVVGMPFGMTGWTPETQPTENKCLSPYYDKDPKLTGFRGSHWLSGSCTQDYGTVTVMPTVGALKVSPLARASLFRHATEVMSPAYYSVMLDDYRTRVELTGTMRSGMLRITFPADVGANLLVEPNAKPGEGFVEVRPERREIVGYNPVHRLYQGAGQSAGFSGYFVVRFQGPVAKLGTWPFHHHEQVSRTLEYAYDDFVASQFAEALGHHADAETFRKRSGNWKNVFDSSVRFVRGRYKNGTWVQPFDPGKPATYITEGVPWQYTFFVPHDMPGLIKAIGGDAAFITKLDGLFAAKLYDQGNEPSHNIAYLYNYAGAPWKTQMRVRRILASRFHTGPGGLPGNDDAGQMSAWYVLSAIGFYPLCPGTPAYTLGSPIFSRIVIHQSNGKDFTVLAPRTSAENRYVQVVRLNGKPVIGSEITHSDITSGATLTFNMGPKPNLSASRDPHEK